MTPEQLSEFSEVGSLVLRGVLDAQELQSQWGELKHAILSGSVQRAGRFVPTPPPPIGDLWKDSRLTALAQQICGNHTLFLNRLLLKDSTWNLAVSIHQDWPYFSGGGNKLTVFLPLSAVKDQGGLTFVKGSHKHGVLPRGMIQPHRFPEMENYRPDLEVGDIVLMDFLTWHYSQKAPSSSDRPLVQIAYEPLEPSSYLAPMVQCTVGSATVPDV